MKNYYITSIFYFISIVSLSNCHKYQYQLYDVEGNKVSDYSTNFSIFALHLSNQSNTFKFKLFKNRVLIPKNYQETLIDRKGVVKLQVHKNLRDCYYDSKPSSDDPSFFVGVNFCGGLNGVMKIHGTNYKVNEIGVGKEGLRWAELESFEEPKNTFKCGVEDQIRKQINLPMRVKRNPNPTEKFYQNFIDEDVKIIEIFIVIDYPVYVKLYGRDKQKALEQTRSAVQVSNRLFQQKEIFLVLTGIEIWSYHHYNIPQGNEMEVLQKLSKERYYKVQLDLPPHDVMLFSILNPGVGAIGFAFVGTLCSSRYSTLWYNDQGNQILTGILLTHEISHVFGLGHNNASCECKTKSKRCIMDPAVYDDAILFSICSDSTFHEEFKHNRDYCLHNLVPYNKAEAICGNGFLENAEECDCGGRSLSKCNRDCCNEDTCKLKATKECASGLCCMTQECKLQTIDYICRLSSGDCDPEEHCNGKSSLCPKDEHEYDGKLCYDNNYCFEGKCMDPNANCELIYGAGTKNSPPECYDMNSKDRSYGNCQKIFYNEKEIVTPCRERDKLCGKVFCDVDNVEEARKTSITNNFNDVTRYAENPPPSGKCVMQDFLSYKSINPGYALNGKKCGKNKMCFKHNCVDRQYILRGGHKNPQEDSTSFAYYNYSICNLLILTIPFAICSF